LERVAKKMVAGKSKITIKSKSKKMVVGTGFEPVKA
jgi:hypothetical protein